MFRVVVDASPLLAPLGGVGWYVWELLQKLEQLQIQESFRLNLALHSNIPAWFKNKQPYLEKFPNLYKIPFPSKVMKFIPESIWFDRLLGNPDIYHGTNYAIFPCQKSLKIMNLYDLTFIRYPQFTNQAVQAYTERVKRALKYTDLVITISESSKQDIIEYLQFEPDKIMVTPLASRYPIDLVPAQPVGAVPCTNKPYILFVSTIEPRKNITALIQAFNLLKQQHGLPHQLVLIGQKGWLYEPIFAEIACSPYQAEIHHLDYVPDASVAWYYAHAEVFAYPSHYEGFGLPVLEAMTLGTPVVTTNTSSLPEVAGDAALLVHPEDPQALAQALTKVLTQSDLRADLVRKGKERSKQYSWATTAQLTLQAYRSLLS